MGVGYNDINGEASLMAEFHGSDRSFLIGESHPRRREWGVLSRIALALIVALYPDFWLFVGGENNRNSIKGRQASFFYIGKVENGMPMRTGWTGIVCQLLQIRPHVVQPFFRLWTEPILSKNTNGSPWTFLFRKASVRFIGLDSAYLTSLRKNREVATASLAWISSSISV